MDICSGEIQSKSVDRSSRAAWETKGDDGTAVRGGLRTQEDFLLLQVSGVVIPPTPTTIFLVSSLWWRRTPHPWDSKICFASILFLIFHDVLGNCLGWY